MDPQPWKCPECRAWVPPHISAHRCDEPGAGESANPVPSDPVPVTTAGGALPNGTLYGVSYAPNESGGVTTEVHIFHA